MADYKHDTGPESGRIVYIRSIPITDLPAEAQAAGGSFYAIHDSDGQRLAVVADRALAFVVARQNAMTPVSVH